ncbi:hypothetical protein Tco_1258547 [Tanacetum coccineum]
MPWAAEIGIRKRVKCYVQGSGRRKRKKVIGRGSEKWPVDEVRSKFTEFFIDNAEFSKDKDSVEKVLSATKLPEGGNSHSAYSPYHLEGKVNFEGVKNVTP